MADIEELRAENVKLRSALAKAIYTADEWCDDSRGCAAGGLEEERKLIVGHEYVDPDDIVPSDFRPTPSEAAKITNEVLRMAESHLYRAGFYDASLKVGNTIKVRRPNSLK